MACCKVRMFVGCHSGCDDFITLDLIASQTGTHILTYNFNGSLITYSFDAFMGEQMTIPNIFNEFGISCFCITNPDETAFTFTGDYECITGIVDANEFCIKLNPELPAYPFVAPGPFVGCECLGFAVWNLDNQNLVEVFLDSMTLSNEVVPALTAPKLIADYGGNFIDFAFATQIYLNGLGLNTVFTVTASPDFFQIAYAGLSEISGAGTLASIDAVLKTYDIEEGHSQCEPIFVCPDDIETQETPGLGGAVVTYTISASDDCTANLVIEQYDGTGFTSGSIFPVGVTDQKYRTTNRSGYTAYCIFTVTVLPL